MRGPAWIRPVTGELLGSALLVAVTFGSGAVRVELGAGTYAPSGTGQLRVRLEARPD